MYICISVIFHRNSVNSMLVDNWTSIPLSENTTTILRRKNIAMVILKTGRFDNIDSAVIISSVSKAV